MKKYFILAAAALTLAACSNEESDNRVDNNVIRLTANMGETTLTRAGTTIQSTAFEENELVNIEVTPSGGSMSAKVYKAGAPSGTVNGLNVNTGDAFTWPASGTVGIKAFYPSSVGSSTASFTVSTDQSATGSATGATDAEKGYKGSDLMYATEISDQAKQSDAVGLTFNHALTKIIVNLTEGSGMSSTDIAACQVQLKAMRTATIASGVAAKATFDAGTAATITMGTGTTLAAIIVPQEIPASTNFITITTSGSHSVSYPLPAAKNFDAGKVYTYNLTVSMSGITLQSTTIQNWDGAGDDKTINGGTLTI